MAICSNHARIEFSAATVREVEHERHDQGSEHAGRPVAVFAEPAARSGASGEPGERER